MSDKPILFSGPMVRALLAGTKTQTRRLIKPRGFRFFEHPVSGWRYEQSRGEAGIVGGGQLDTVAIAPYLPYAAGDRLYVREHWCTDAMFDDTAPHDLEPGTPVQYGADGDPKLYAGGIYPGRLRIGMHMPRWASRITLTVTDVRVQRLQEISEEDAIAEGIEDVTSEVASSDPSLRFWKRYRDGGWNGYVDTAIGSYASLWTEINGDGSWEANPWVAATTFEVELCNIAEARNG